MGTQKARELAQKAAMKYQMADEDMMGYSEIAQELGCSRKHAIYIVSCALRKFKRKLEIRGYTMEDLFNLES